MWIQRSVHSVSRSWVFVGLMRREEERRRRRRRRNSGGIMRWLVGGERSGKGGGFSDQVICLFWLIFDLVVTGVSLS